MDVTVPPLIRRALYRIAVFPILMVPSSCGWPDDGFLAAAGPIAQAQRDHLLSIMGWMSIVVLPLFVAVPWVLWKYRFAGRSPDYRPEWESSRILELLVWGLPAIVVTILGYNLWHATYRLDPYAPVAPNGRPLDVQVVAMDWKFLFIYPKQKIASANELVFPAGRPLRLHLTSETVMQSFMIPRIGGQIYVMAGMVTELNLLAGRRGKFTGLNTQYDGAGFAKQKFEARAVSPRDFHRWVEAVRRIGGPLDAQRYRDLARPSVIASPRYYASVPSGFFGWIVSRFSRSGNSSYAARRTRRVAPAEMTGQ